MHVEQGKKEVFEMNAWEIAQMRPPHKNVAVAMVAACIKHYWDRGMELESITLNKHKYELLRDFVRVMWGEEAADARDYWWHGVRIIQGRIITGEPLSVELKKPKAQA